MPMRRAETAISAVIARSESDEAIRTSCTERWIASRSLSSGAHSRDPLARNDDAGTAFAGDDARIRTLLVWTGDEFSVTCAVRFDRRIMMASERATVRDGCWPTTDDVSPCQAAAVGRTRPVAVVGLGARTMQHGFRECDLCHRHARRPMLARGCAIDDQGIAAGLRRRPEQRHVGLPRDILGSGCTHGAADTSATKLDRHMTGVRTIFRDRE